MDAGTFQGAGGTVTGDLFSLNGGAVTLSGATTFNMSFAQAGGTFGTNGGDAKTVTITGDFSLFGRNVQCAERRRVAHSRRRLCRHGTPTFNHDSGTVTLAASGFTAIINSGNIVFNNLKFQGSNSYFGMQGTTIVAGDIAVADTNTAFATCFNGGSAAVNSGRGQRDLHESGVNDGWGECGDDVLVQLVLNGSGTQTINSTADALPGSIILASTGTVKFVGDVYATQLTYVSGGFDAGTSTYHNLDPGPNNQNISMGSNHLYKVNLEGPTIYYSEPTVIGTLYVDSDLLINVPDGVVAGGTVQVAGNVTQTKDNGGGDLGITFAGAGTQTWTYTAGVVPGGTFQVGTGVTLVQNQRASATWNAQTLPGPTTAGDTIAVLVQWYSAAGSATISSVQDGAGNTFTPIAASYKSSSNGTYSQFATQVAYTTGITAAATETVTVNFSSAPDFAFVSLYELTPSSLDQATGVSIASTNALMSAGTVTPGANGELGLVTMLDGGGSGGNFGPWAAGSRI